MREHRILNSSPPPSDPDGCVYASQPIPEGQWTHVAAVYDAGNVKLFVQGALVAEETARNQHIAWPNGFWAQCWLHRGWGPSIF